MSLKGPSCGADGFLLENVRNAAEYSGCRHLTSENKQLVVPQSPPRHLSTLKVFENVHRGENITADQS
jgi:hypothetical protein